MKIVSSRLEIVTFVHLTWGLATSCLFRTLILDLLLVRKNWIYLLVECKTVISVIALRIVHLQSF